MYLNGPHQIYFHILRVDFIIMNGSNGIFHFIISSRVVFFNVTLQRYINKDNKLTT